MEDLSYTINIIIILLILISLGAYLITNKKILKKVAVILLISLLPLTIYNAFRNNKFEIGMTKDKSEDQKSLSQEQIMLDRVISVERDRVAALSQETAEVLYFIHKNAIPLTFRIPQDGVLDTAIGIDPLITNIFTGNVYFELFLTQKETGTQTILRKDITLSSLPEEGFVWQRVNLDLSKYSGQEVTLSFNKGYAIDSEKKPEVVYDLTPTDFMYWSAPRVRPRNLEDKYNVILISLDTLRADHLHFMGYKRDTSPNLDMIAHNGVYFTTAVSQAPWTIPSHFSIFTSTYPSVHGGKDPVDIYYAPWNGKLPTMASILRDKGHLTAAFTGKGSISARFGFYKGFDFYNETNSFENGECVGDVETVFNKSIKWLSENNDRNFFLFIHTYEPHSPYCDDFFVRQEKIKNAESDIEYRTAKYDGDIRRTDFYVGVLMDKLNELGLTDNTIIVITSDHGEDLGGRMPPEAVLQYGHGHHLYDEVLLVPLIFHNP